MLDSNLQTAALQAIRINLVAEVENGSLSRNI